MIIQLLNGTSFDTADYNLKRLFHRIPSADINHDMGSVDGRSDIITNSKLNNRIISVEFLYDAYDIYDFYLLRDRLNDLFVRTEAFYIIFKREPYKRYKVKLASQFEIEPSPTMESFTVEFITQNVYAESIYKTTEFVKEWDINQHAWNGTIDWDGVAPVYTFNSNNFIVKNLGNKTIDPREDYLEITLRGNFASFVSITNATTGDVYRYNKSLPSTVDLKLSSVRTLRAGVSDFVSTNKKLIKLAPGNNQIVVDGGTVNSINFDFRYLYK